MKKYEYIKSICVMLALATIFLSVAFLTITKSFALSDKLIDRLFNVRITNINSIGIKLDDIRVTNTNILFNVHLSYTNPSNTLIMDVTNNGSVDAKINSIETKYYNDNYLFEYNNNKYYLSDFTVYTVSYANDNIDNNVVMDGLVSKNDNLLINTNNKMKVCIRLKYDSELSLDEKEALNYYLSELDINESILLNIDYQEK